MEIKKVITNALEENCYVFSSDGEGIIVDPGGAAQKIIKATEGIKIKYILLTHGHFDHIFALKEVKDVLGAEVLVPEDDIEMLSDSRKSMGAPYGFYHGVMPFDRELSEGDEITFGNITLRALKTPGHSKGSMCYFGNGILISGDVLFKGTIGRFEFENKNLMVSSLKKLFKLPGETVVYPGHGDVTTIDYELKFNPYADME